MEELDDYNELVNDDDVLDQLDRLKARLAYFFMDPVEKWRHKQTRPWKLLVQTLKIIIFTSQLVVFGKDMAKFINYKEEMQVTLKQLLLRDWDPSADAIAYPGPYVPYAVYTKTDFIQTVNHAIRIYSNITHAGVGQYGYQSNNANTVSPIGINLIKYAQSDFDPSVFHYNYSMFTIEDYVTIDNYADAGSEKWLQIDFRKFLKSPLRFESLVSLRLDFPLRTILMEDATTGYADIVCFELDVEILFDNRHRIGQIIISLTGIPTMVSCQGQLTEANSGSFASRRTLNFLVISFCLASFCLCIRSLIRAFKLLRTTENIFRSHAKRLLWSDRLEFIDFWLVSIIFNDLMVGFATVIMTFYNGRLLETNNYTLCSLLLGLGNLLSWSGLLRYLSFFKKYNLLIVTLRKSFIHVLRFMLCTTLIYW